jgi:ubiquinone/menaquinone biosynthesis C-methylase UbiE
VSDELTANLDEAKLAAIEQWTADPCGANEVPLEPGKREYFEQLLAERRRYAPWMAEALDYAGARGRDALDVGCGQGIDLANFAMAGANATGIDLTPRHVELAKAHAESLGLTVNVVRGDAEEMPFADNSFDRVSSNGVLHHTPAIEAALREVRRVLRPGGEARIIVYNKSSVHYWAQQFLYEGIRQGHLREEGSMEGVLSRGVEHSSIGARPLVRVYSPRQLRRLMRDAGFRDVSTFVRHYAISDSWLTAWLHPRFSRLEGSKPLELLGRAAGWYVTGVGRK